MYNASTLFVLTKLPPFHIAWEVMGNRTHRGVSFIERLSDLNKFFPHQRFHLFLFQHGVLCILISP